MMRFWMYFEGQVDKWYKRKKRVEEDPSKFLTRSSLRMELPIHQWKRWWKKKVCVCVGGALHYCMLGLKCPLNILGRYQVASRIREIASRQEAM